MTSARLHLDADTSNNRLLKALIERKLDVTKTPNSEVKESASDEFQLSWATKNRRIIFTFNVKDFVRLHNDYPQHAGIILASQARTTLPMMISGLSIILTESTCEEWIGQIGWLSDWII
jgi:hypothetical protein